MQSSSTHSTPPPSHTGSVGDLGLTGSAIKEEKKSNRKPGMVTNVHGIIRDVISNATSQIDTMDPQVSQAATNKGIHTNFTSFTSEVELNLQ